MLADPTIRIMVYQPINAAPQKSRSTLSIVLIVVGAVVALCCVGGVAGGGFLYYTYSSNAGPVREATTTYVDDVRAGDYESAYGMLCRKIRDTTSLDDYARIQDAQLKISAYEITGVKVANRNGRTSAYVTTRMTQEETGAEFTQTFALAKENGQWRICR